MMYFTMQEMNEFLQFISMKYGLDSDQIYNSWQTERNRFWAIDSDAIIDAASKALDVDKNLLFVVKTKSRHVQDCKKIICHHLKYKMSIKDIGRKLHLTHGTIWRNNKSYDDLYGTDEKFKKKSDHVNLELIKILLKSQGR